MKQLIFLILLLISCSFGSSKYAGEFITGSVDARGLALGNNILTSFSDGSVAYYNPAALPEIKNSSISLSHSDRFDGLINQEFISYATKMDNHFFGISIIRVGVDDIPITKLENEGGTISEGNRPYISKYVNDNELAFIGSYGMKYNDNINFGGSAKILYKGFEIESAYGIGFDLSMLYKYNKDLIFGAKVQDITTSALFWSTGENEFIKPSIYAGGEYNFYWEYLGADVKLLGGSKIGTEGYDSNSDISFSEFDILFNGGAELLFGDVFTLRGGSEMDRWGCGAGVTLFGANLDYSFKPHNDLGDTHKVSISYSWE